MNAFRHIFTAFAVLATASTAYATSLAPVRHVQVGERITVSGDLHMVYAIGGEAPEAFAIETGTSIQLNSRDLFGGSLITTNKIYLELGDELPLLNEGEATVEGTAVINTYCGVESGCYTYLGLRHVEFIDNAEQPLVCTGDLIPGASYISREPLRCAAMMFACADGFETFFDECGCGCKPVESSEPYPVICAEDLDPTASYISREPMQCAAMRFRCVDGLVPFFNDCGCGCKAAAEPACPTSLDCMPPLSPNSPCRDLAAFEARCPDTFITH